MGKGSEKKILLDSDVIRHFIKGGALHDLVRIYPNRLVILKTVKDELCRKADIEVYVNNFISFCKVQVMDFPDDINIIKAYAELRKELKGEGESAVMAVARYTKDIIASSNLADTYNYCKLHQIEYLTTMDILLYAKESGIYTEGKCNEIITENIAKESRFPCKSLSQYQVMLNNKTYKTTDVK